MISYHKTFSIYSYSKPNQNLISVPKNAFELQNDLEGSNAREAIGEKAVPNITTEKTYSSSSTLPNSTGSFNNAEKLQQDHLNKGKIDQNSLQFSFCRLICSVTLI